MTDRAPILDQIEGHWQKILVAVMWKLSKSKPIVITHQDLLDLERYMQHHKLLTWGHKDSIELRLVTPAAAEALAKHAREQGGKVQ
jgi:hypothetical protein